MNVKVVICTSALILLLSACIQDQQVIKEERKTDEIAALHPQSQRPPVSDQDHVGNLPSTEINKSLSSATRLPAGSSKFANKRFVLPSARETFYDQSGMRGWQAESNRDVYASLDQNSVKRVIEEPVSTLSVDVDTGAYAIVRKHLNEGRLPPGNAVRIEEMINYFDYAYEAPHDTNNPFSVTTEIAPTPWNENTHLVQLGIQGYRPQPASRSPANLVFLIDVSGSMNAADKLPLLKNAFRLLVNQMNSSDKISMVVYAGSSGVVLETTAGDRKGDILAALDNLSAGGATHGSAGIQLAYDMAQQSFIRDGVNRVILATDGDFNVGTVNHDALLDVIERKKSKGISLTTLGFGSGNYNDHLMEQLADHGDGNYAYIDNLNEARKTLVEQISATLETIAKDVKIQIEWNPASVSEYRLIGYENRLLKREDFNNDAVDAGEIGAGHSVTALYEITLVDSDQQRIEGLRYQADDKSANAFSEELAFLKLRYKKPQGKKSRLIQHALKGSEQMAQSGSASHDFRFASAVAAFGELLRGGDNLQQFGYDEVLNLAQAARGKDALGYRAEFVRLVELARLLQSNG